MMGAAKRSIARRTAGSSMTTHRLCGNFVRTTKFAMEQFDERILKKNLPSELSKVDLLAVARIHFADLSEEYLQFVVEAALAVEAQEVVHG